MKQEESTPSAQDLLERAIAIALEFASGGAATTDDITQKLGLPTLEAAALRTRLNEKVAEIQASPVDHPARSARCLSLVDMRAYTRGGEVEGWDSRDQFKRHLDECRYCKINYDGLHPQPAWLRRLLESVVMPLMPVVVYAAGLRVSRLLPCCFQTSACGESVLLLKLLSGPHIGEETSRLVFRVSFASLAGRLPDVRYPLRAVLVVRRTDDENRKLDIDPTKDAVEFEISAPGEQMVAVDIPRSWLDNIEENVDRLAIVVAREMEPE